MFLETIDLHRTLNLNSHALDNLIDNNNFKRTIIFPVTQVNINKFSTQNSDWRYHYSVMWVTQQWVISHENV